MATLCTNCGTPLRADAKFCNNCGTLTPSHPFSPRATPSSNGMQPRDTGRSDNTRPALREQIAHFPQNTARPVPVRRPGQDEPPSWMSQLENGKNSSDRQTSSAGFEADKTPQLDFPVPEPLPRPNSLNNPSSSQRELRVKVWHEEEPISSPGLSGHNPGTWAEDAMDNLPTSPLNASPSHSPVARNATSAPSRTGQDSRLDELERMDTEHLAASPSSQPALQPSQGGFDQAFALAQQPTSSFVRGTASGAVPQHYEPASSRPTNQPAQSNMPVSRAAQRQPLQQTPPPHAVVTTSRHKQRRKPFVLIVGLLVILLLGGIGVWVGVFHPFSVPTVVQPQQSFSNSQLAFSVQYPSGWNTRVDSSSSSAFFADSSNTAQFTVTVSPVDGKDAGQYVQQLSTQLKMTGIRPVSAIAFGGASWQQVQGNAVFGGANYSETILATVHSNHLYTITQSAPQSTYVQEEQIVFSPMRASFKFL